MDLEPPPAKHHRLIIRRLEAVERGELHRLMIFTPPGYAKSTYASVPFPPWYLGRNPRKKIVTGSYNTDLSDYFGRKARNVVNSDQFFNIFGISLDPELGKAIGEWGLTHSGEYYGTGVGAGVTGRRGDLLLLDEPTAGLDLLVEEEFMTLLMKLNQRMSILLVSHDVAFVSQHVKTVICVNRTVRVHHTSKITSEILRDTYGTDITLIHHHHNDDSGTESNG